MARISSAFFALLLFPSALSTAAVARECGGKNIETSIIECTKVIDGSASSNKLAAAYFARASAYWQKNLLDKTIADLTEAVRLKPDWAAAHQNRGTAHNMKREMDLAISDYDKALRLDPKGPSAWQVYFLRAQAWNGKGSYDEAISDYDQAIRLNRKSGSVYFARSIAWREKGDFRKAFSDIDQAIKMDPENATYYADRGLIYRASKDSERGLADFGRALRLRPDFPRALVGRGLIHESKGDFDKARADYQSATALPSAFEVRPGVKQDNGRDQDTARARLAALANAVNAEVPTATGRRIALVIGNGAYTGVSALLNPPNDAHKISKDLRTIGFEVTEGVDLNRTQMNEQIRAFLLGATNAEVALLFYAGHGIQIEGKNYLVPIDAQIKAEQPLQVEMISLDTILAGLDDKVRTNIVFLDACRDNPILAQTVASADVRRSFAIRSGLAAPSEIGRGATLGAGTLIAFSTAPGATALDGDGENSPFSAALTRHISTPGLEIQQMLTRVRAEVVAATGTKQVPWSNSSLLGEIYLVPSK